MKKIISAILACLILASCVAFAIPATAATSEGFFPGWSTRYRLNQDLSATPHTFEAVVKFPAAYATYKDGGPGVGGMIIGNYNGRGDSEYFGVYYGHPELYWVDEGNSPKQWDDITFRAYFEKVPVSTIYSGKPVNITIVRDFSAKKVICYINGKEAQTLDFSDCTTSKYFTETRKLHTSLHKNWYVIGGDMRAVNRRYIRAIGNTDENKATINKIALYNDARTVAEVQNDYANFGNGGTGSGLVAYFNFAGYSDEPVLISSDSGKYTADRDYVFSKNPKFKGDYAYSLAFVGDTQSLVHYNPDNVALLFDWIIANKDAKKIGYVVGLGDITETSVPAEYKSMLDNYNRLEGVVPYIPLRGNHDETSVSLTDKDKTSGRITYDSAITTYAKAFSNSVPVGQRMNKDSLLNFYVTENIAGVPYMFLCLNFGATDAELAWASDVVKKNSNYNVIVVTHGYFNYDGTTLSDDDRHAPTHDTANNANSDLNNGDDIWNKFISQYENICMVVSGHIGCDDEVIVPATGVNGNTVVQVLIDHQDADMGVEADGGLGIVSMFYFLGDGKTVKTEAISTVKAANGSAAYFYESNQQTFTLDLRGTLVDFDKSGVTDIPDLLLVLGEFLKPTGNDLYDVNADGKVSLVDILRVAKDLIK